MWNICLQLIHTEHQFLSLICCSVETLETIKDQTMFMITKNSQGNLCNILPHHSPSAVMA